jgi:hypothetical protein
MPFIALAIVLAAALGGGTSIAAQNALPGDALWGFKVGVNENIRAAIAAEGKSQANWDIIALETRLDEAEKLAAEGKLNAETQATLEANYNAHVHSVSAQIAKLEEKGDYAAAADVAARFQAAVASHASGLAEAQAHADIHAQDVLANVLSKVHATLDSASTLSAEASAKAAANADTSVSNTNTTSGGSTGTSGNANVNTNVNVGGQVQGSGSGAGASGSATGGVRIDL